MRPLRRPRAARRRPVRALQPARAEGLVGIAGPRDGRRSRSCWRSWGSPWSVAWRWRRRPVHGGVRERCAGRSGPGDHAHRHQRGQRRRPDHLPRDRPGRSDRGPGRVRAQPADRAGPDGHVHQAGVRSSGPRFETWRSRVAPHDLRCTPTSWRSRRRPRGAGRADPDGPLRAPRADRLQERPRRRDRGGPPVRGAHPRRHPGRVPGRRAPRRGDRRAPGDRRRGARPRAAAGSGSSIRSTGP